MAIAALMVRQHQISERQAIAAEQAARLLKQQQDALQAQKDRDAALWKRVEENKGKNANVTTHDTYKTYIP